MGSFSAIPKDTESGYIEPLKKDISEKKNRSYFSKTLAVYLGNLKVIEIKSVDVILHGIISELP